MGVETILSKQPRMDRLIEKKMNIGVRKFEGLVYLRN